MQQGQDLKKIERWAYLFCHEDGLIDIVVGLIAISFGLMIASDRVIFWLIFYILGIGLWRASERWITYPRKDCVNTSNKGSSGNAPALIGLFVALLLLVFVLGFILVNLEGVAA